MTISDRLRRFLEQAVKSSRLLDVLQSDETRIATVFGFIALLGILSSAGVLSGVALFLISVVAANPVNIILSSLLLSTSVVVVVAIYLWITR